MTSCKLVIAIPWSFKILVIFRRPGPSPLSLTSKDLTFNDCMPFAISVIAILAANTVALLLPLNQ